MSLLEKITAETQQEHATRMELLARPATVASIALAEATLDILGVTGFLPHVQILFSTDSWVSNKTMRICVHADIFKSCYLDGLVRLKEILPGTLTAKDTERGSYAYAHNGAEIEITAHAQTYIGWTPDVLPEA
jgi:hypothetical protein